MRLTRRGERVLIGAALVAGAVLGASAQVWNPYTRHLDTVTVQLAPGVEEDEAVCLGTREISYEATSDGALVVCQAPR